MSTLNGIVINVLHLSFIHSSDFFWFISYLEEIPYTWDVNNYTFCFNHCFRSSFEVLLNPFVFLVLLLHVNFL